jgi:uncharacterized protein (TIGR03435 family)
MTPLVPIVGAGILVLVIASPFGQSPAVREGLEPVAFEVASVKPNPAKDARGGMGPQPGGRFEALNATPLILITYAYGVRPEHVDGAPDWIRTERVDIRARAADPAATVTDMRLMLQALLAERFGLSARRVARNQTVYALVRSRTDRLGQRLRPVDIDCVALDREIAAGKAPAPAPPAPSGPVLLRFIRSRAGSVHSGGITMPVLAQVLTPNAERLVVDKTGLSGTYALELDFRPNAAPIESADADPWPVLVTALAEQLGLKLVGDRAEVPSLVVDRISRPTPD